jgi:hypothetical protein
MSRNLSLGEQQMLRADTVERAAKSLTRKQREGMVRIRDRGPYAWAAGQWRSGGAISRMFDRLISAGLVEGPPFKCTAFGLRVLASTEPLLAKDRT